MFESIEPSSVTGEIKLIVIPVFSLITSDTLSLPYVDHVNDESLTYQVIVRGSVSFVQES